VFIYIFYILENIYTMAKKLNIDPNNIIESIIKRFEDLTGIFDNLFLYEQQLLHERPRHIFSVEDCRVIVNEYIEYIPPIQRTETLFEILSERLLLLYNWQKCKIVYRMNVLQNAVISDEYINPNIFNKFPYPGVYIDYNFKNTDYYGVFVTYYKQAEEMHLQKRLLLGFVKYEASYEIWSIEPVFFDIKNNISIIESISRTMTDVDNLNNDKRNYFNTLSNLSCLVVKFLSTIIEYYDLEPKIKRSHTYKKFSKHNNEYDVKVEISNTIKLNKDKIVYQKRRNDNPNNKSTPKSPHPRRAHTREIAVKNEFGEIVGHRTIWISASYVHGDEVNKPINLKNVED